ncbi:S-adenosylmethionine carrier 1, chloroplastic/mitochondrial-like [Salvia splendens]|uniref:S-adenosylmethionine carrier 1, chloroplastic/mitochondrial-like n=1 Tax=Salvia splendens TaxID=180675 RepID=UPI001C2549FD|nr:S-adenosylmethionine carrier 1, chloroplastic/mitochondrial-like [Salvia splendens]
MAIDHSTISENGKPLTLSRNNHSQFFVWREFLWGAIAGAFGEGMMHPVDTIKTRMQSQAIFSGSKNQKSAMQMVRAVWATDGLAGLYRGIAPGVMGSLATGATYFGVIESTKNWMDETYPGVGGHWAHFLAGAIGDTLGSIIYVPCEVMKQRMQVQGSKKYWTSVLVKEGSQEKLGMPTYGYYPGMFQAGHSIWKEQGLRGLYAGYWSTLARDVPFAGLMVTFYEAFKTMSQYGRQGIFPNSDFHTNSTFEGLVLGGLAGGLSAYLTTPLDVIKTRLQVQGSTIRYTGWLDAVYKVWHAEGVKGMFRGGVPRIAWYVPASALTFMAVEFLRDHHKSTSISIEKKESSLQEAS